MATQNIIETVTVRGRAEGLDVVETALDKVAVAHGRVAEASDAAAKVTETSSRRQLSAAGAFERLSAQIDPAFRAQQQLARGQVILDRSMEQGVISANQYAAALERLRARYAPLGAANSNLVGQTGNLAAQFNDIAVQLASGTSPFLIAMQQGTQISQVLGGGGAGGAVKALGGAFLSLLSPVNLVTIGAIAAGGALLHYLTGAGKEVQSLDDKLKQHAELIASVKNSYGEAAKGLEAYAAQSGAVLEVQLRAKMETIKGDLQRMQIEINQAMSRSVGPAFTDIASGAGFGGTITEIDPKFKAFANAIDRLNEASSRGEPGIRAFREEVARISQAAQGDAKIQAMAAELFKFTEAAEKTERMAAATARALRLIEDAANSGIGDIRQYGDAFKALSNIALPKLSDQDRALVEYRRAIQAAGGREERASADTAFLAAQQRIAEREAEKASEEARRKAEADAQQRERSYERTLDRINDQTRALEQQAATYGMGAGEIARYRVEQELLNAAWEAGKADTPQLRAGIAVIADEAAAAAERMEDLQRAAEWSDFGKSTLRGFISDLQQGKSAAEAFENVLNRLIDRLLDLAMEGMFSSKGGGFNPLGFLFGGGGINASSITAPVGASINANFTGSLAPAFEAAAKSVNGFSSNIDAAAMAIRTIESGSAIGNYGALGPLTAKGDRAYGAYQVMGNNVGPWTERHWGERLTPSQFLSNREAQDAVFRGEFGSYMDRFGPEGAAQAWFGGPGSVGRLARTDVLGTTIGGYGSRFSDLYGKYSGQATASVGGLSPMAAVDTAPLTDAVQQVSTDLSSLSPNLQSFGADFQAIGNSLTQYAPQMQEGLGLVTSSVNQGGFSIDSAFQTSEAMINQGANGLGSAFTNAINALSSNSGGGGLLGLFKGIGGGADSGMDGFGSGSEFFPLMHSGGQVGRDASGWRNIHPAYFDDAPRYHSGLRPDEVPAILQQGEWVLSRDDVAGIRSAGQGGGGGITVNNQVVNQSSAQVETKAVPNGSGGVDILTVVSDRVKGDMAREAGRNGGFAKAMGAPFNGRG